MADSVAKTNKSKGVFRFKLRSLLIAVTFFAFLAAGWKQFVVPFRRQAAAIEDLRKAPAKIWIQPPRYEWQKKFLGMQYATVLRCEDAPANADSLSRINDLIFLHELYLPRTNATDAIASKIGQLRNLRVLSMWRTELSDTGVSSLANCSNLEVLDIHTTRVTDRGLKSLVRLKKLRQLVLGGLISGRGLESIAKLKNLIVLDLRRSNVAVNGLKYLHQSPLRELKLPRCDLDVAACQTLASLPNLQTLHVNGSISGEGQSLLSSKKPGLSLVRAKVYPLLQPSIVDSIDTELERLLSTPNRQFVENAGRRNIAIAWPGRLAELDIEARGGNSTVHHFQKSGDIVFPVPYSRSPGYPATFFPGDMARIAEYEHVYVKKTKQEDLRKFNELFRLRSLHIDDPNFSDVQLLALTLYNPKPITQIVTVPFGAITPDGVLRFRDKHSTKVRLRFREPLPLQLGSFLDLSEVSQPMVNAVSKKTSIRNLRLSNVMQRVDLNPLSRLPQLSSLELYASEQQPMNSWSLSTDLANVTTFHANHRTINDENADALQHLPSVEDLSLIGAPISDFSLEHLKNGKSLRTLDLRSLSDGIPGIRGSGFQWLKDCSELKEIDLTGNPIEGRFLKYLKQLPQLETLVLSQTTVDDVGCRHLAQIPNLKTLYLIRSERITDAGVAELAKSQSLQQLFIGSHAITNTGLMELIACKSLQEVRLYLTAATLPQRKRFNELFNATRGLTSTP